MATLLELELYNFKTYYKSNLVKFIGQLTVVIGPNGTGKSNFFDGIAFAMGDNLTNLRTTSFKKLAHSSTSKTDEVFVRVVLESADGAKNCFKRALRGNSYQCYINDTVVNFHVYENELKKLNIHTRLKNYLIYQESIESIIMKAPKERTRIFEELSGSGAFKSEYDRIKADLDKCSQDFMIQLSNKQDIMKDIKKIRTCKQETVEYTELMKEHENAKLELVLFNLYYGKKELNTLALTEQSLEQEIQEIQKQKFSKETKLHQLVSYCDKLKKQIKDIGEPKDIEVKALLDKISEIKVEKDHLNKRIRTCTELHESAKKADEVRKSTIRDLEDELKKLTRAKAKYNQRYAETLGSDVELSDSQADEYEKLKDALSIACASNNARLVTLEPEFENLKAIYDCERTKEIEIVEILEKKRGQLDLVKARIEKLEDIKKKESERLEIESAKYVTLTTEFQKCQEEHLNLKKTIDNISNEISDCDYDKIGKKKEEIVRRLKIEFSGVYNRLSELCRPIHMRYNIAVTKVLGKNMDAIVVDNNTTARKCIEYLRDNEVGTSTFLPLEQLPECNLLNRLRAINNPPNVKLVYDVIEFEPAEISKAIFYATGNALVCETREDASKVAYDTFSERYNCVSLDGCYYKKSGIISGGHYDLVKKAKIWDSQKRKSLMTEKESLTAKLREILKTASKQSDLPLLEETIKNGKTHLKLIDSDIYNTRKELDTIENNIAALEEKREALKENVVKAKRNMDKAFEAMSKFKSNNADKEKEIFADFCKYIGVTSVEEYENGKRSYDERIQNFDQQINRIQEQLSFENNRNTESNVKRWEENLKKLISELNLINEQETNKIFLLEEKENELESNQLERHSIESQCNEIMNKTVRLREQIATLANKSVTLTNTLNEVQAKIKKERLEYHNNLRTAEMSGFSIVATDNLTPSSLSQPSESVSINLAAVDSSATYELELNSEIDFSRLPNEFRELENDEIHRARKNLENTIFNQLKKIESMSSPEMLTSQHLILAQEKLAEVNQHLKDIQNKRKSINANFNIVKDQRYEKFMTFFQQLVVNIDTIYKKLTKNLSAQAYLTRENQDEPYLGGIHFHCVAPGKRFITSDNLSGGEKTVAALSILYSIQSVDEKRSTFVILDEVDAALDNKNIRNVMRYTKKNYHQVIDITHKKETFPEADTIIGISSEVGEEANFRSVIFTLDLSRYHNS